MNAKDDTEKSKDLTLEIKLFRALALSYFFFGLFEIFEFGVFLVPIPIVFYIVPALGLVYALLTRDKWQAIVLLLLPVLVIQQIYIAEYPNLFQVLSLLAIFAWTLWGVRFLFVPQLKKLIFTKVLGYSHLVIPLVLMPINSWIAYLALIVPGIGAALFFVKNQENKEILADLRVALLIVFIQLLLLLFLFSMWTITW
ncbi:MAG: hypothetical protein ACI9N1_001421 [Flavobacteriales bacterium]|jgi:hypothetical protein